MLLSVQDQFVPKIQDGTKPFSIRSFRKDGRIPKPGEKIFMYHGSRYKKGKRPRVFPQGMEPTIGFVGIIGLSDNLISINEGQSFFYDPLLLPGCSESHYNAYCRLRITITDKEKFALMDGFNCFADQLAFFEKLYGLPFSGLIIFWKLHPEWLRMRGVQ